MSQPGTADERAAQTVRDHHAQLAAALHQHAAGLISAARANAPDAVNYRDELLQWLHHELLPHAAAEEATLYPAAAAQPAGTLLVDGMLAEHQLITELVDEVAAASSPVTAAAAARALTAVFDTHLGKENDLVLPLLVQAADVSLARLLAGMHDLVGADAHGGADAPGGAAGDQPAGDQPAGGCGCGGCGCGGDQKAAAPEQAPVLSVDPRLDVREIPHDRRHATIHAALDAVPVDGALVLVAPHAPLPLLAELDARHPGRFERQWLQSGPQVWQVRLVHVGTPG